VTPNTYFDNYAIGTWFGISEACQCTGYSFRTWKVGAHTMRVRLWINGVAQVIGAGSATYIDVACDGPGVYTGSFVAPIALSAANIFRTTYRISIWCTGGDYRSQPTTPLGWPAIGYGYSFGRWYLMIGSGYNSGDAEPLYALGSYYAPIDPILAAA
jgi:hypothetical protein